MDLKIDFDDSVLKSIKRKLKELHNTHTEWGWINEKTYPTSDVGGRDNIKIAEIARINEYGGISKSRKGGNPVRVPARPYFRQALMITEQSALKYAQHAFMEVLGNRDFNHILEKQARLAALDIILSIKKQNMAPLAQKTIRLKGHDIQWVNTGILMSNITYRVYKTNIDKAKGGNSP